MIESPSSFLVSPRPGASLTGTVSQNGPPESLPRTWGPPLTPDLRRTRAPRMGTWREVLDLTAMKTTADLKNEGSKVVPTMNSVDITLVNTADCGSLLEEAN